MKTSHEPESAYEASPDAAPCKGRIPKHRGFYILPNLFTTASLFSGFLAIIWAASGNFENCAMAILFSALMDSLDGRVARLTGTSSEFGVQYDSLADLVSFGVAPGFMIFQKYLLHFKEVGIAAAFLFCVCAALRLARFNVQTATANKRFFTGMPTPVAGCALACLLLFVPSLPEAFSGIMPGTALVFTSVLAFLMVSRIRYASFKEMGFMKAHPFSTMVFVILSFALIASNPKVFGFLVLFGYILSGPVHTFYVLPRMARKENRMHQHGGGPGAI